MPNPLTITVTRTVTVPASGVNDFVELICGGEDHAGDLLLHGLSGYWLFGVKLYDYDQDNLRGWLVRDQYADEVLSVEDVESLDMLAIEAIRYGVSQHPGYYFVDRRVALKILEAGVKRHGEAFYDGACDYGDIDNVVQTVLLGEVIYG